MFSSIADMVQQAEKNQLPLSRLVQQSEAAQTDSSVKEIRARMQQRLEVMRRSAEQGVSEPIKSLSGISGGNAYRLWGWLQNNTPVTGPILSRAVARAMAVNEVNAGMGCIVATPHSRVSRDFAGRFTYATRNIRFYRRRTG